MGVFASIYMFYNMFLTSGTDFLRTFAASNRGRSAAPAQDKKIFVYCKFKSVGNEKMVCNADDGPCGCRSAGGGNR